ncbi:helix-turn-helix domain-containing protein [Solihabitans fulvus]|uniref:Helix-turn-helix domain-containing protein n=1 Tax=Solihabitans fulvus TaxID=1892852 RepID=A0A5B2XK98_9PSEU|nr:Scr1 family TA system antitoxin-like transcriptional regulator [Solihabitans fulvus]KAA2264298.1 helix-turn-helix domain-containing protein [Solihabitans fulvus]
MTEPDPGPVVQRILLGADLRDARDAAALSNADASKALGWYTGKLSKIEQGDMKVTDKDLDKAVRLYKIPADHAAKLRQLSVDARRKLPPARVPAHGVKYVNLERAATELKIFNADCFPGTVQTADYARAVLARSVTVSPADVDRMAEDRTKRLERMKSPNAPRLWLVVGEEALCREIGGPAVLRAQLEQVRELAELPHVCVQVVPFDGGAHASHGVAFSIVTLIEGRSGIVFIEGLTATDYLGGEHARIYDLAFENLRATTLSQQRTMERITQRIGELA